MTSGYAQDAGLLVEAGLLYPKVFTRTNSAASQLAYDLSPRSQVRVSGSVQTFSFDSNAFTSGSSYVINASWTRRVSSSQTLGVSWGQTFFSNTIRDIQGLLGTWQASLSSTVVIDAQGGVRPYTLPGEDGYIFTAGGRVHISWRPTPSGTFNARYERAVEQAYGLSGTHLGHRFSAGYEEKFGRRVTANADVNYGINYYPQDPDHKLAGRSFTSTLNYLFAQNLMATTGYSLWVRRETGQPEATTYRVTMSLSYVWSW